MTAQQLRHDAFVYDSDTAFVDRMVPFLETGLQDGESAVAVTRRANCALLHDALGASASPSRSVPICTSHGQTADGGAAIVTASRCASRLG